jgi:hypothetical protein
MQYPGDTSQLWNAWNMTQVQAEAFIPTVTPLNYTSNLETAGIPVRLWQGSTDTTASVPQTASFIAGVGITGSEVLVLGMAHAYYYNKGMVDFLDQYLPKQPLSSISCPYGVRTGAQMGVLVTGTTYKPQSFNQTRNRYWKCLGASFP